MPPPQPVVHASDYESDNQGYQSDYPVHAPPANRTIEEINLSVLKRYNSEIVSIRTRAPYAVIYEFSPVPQPEWTKTGIEGSLFLCELTTGIYGEIRYSAIVLNRRGLDNFEAELREGENAGVELSGEYIILSFKEGHGQKIYGVYIFHDGPGTSTENAQEYFGELMKTMAIEAGISRQNAEIKAAKAAAEHTNGHIQEASETLVKQQANAPAPGQQINLQQLFGQHRAEDAAFSVRGHNYDGAVEQPHPAAVQPQQSQTQTLVDLFNQPRQPPQQPPQQAQTLADLFKQSAPAPIPQQPPDVLGDLFRRAGLGAR
jgi:hypothetical protein